MSATVGLRDVCVGWLSLCLASLPQAGFGDTLREELARMGERLGELEEELDATREELRASQKRVDAQAERLARVDLASGEEESSGWARFLAETEFSGWVATSYVYNFNRPDAEGGQNANIGNPDLGVQSQGLVYAFHPDDDRFELDQLWFSLHKPARPDSRGGFAVDIVFGQTANELSGNLSADGNRPYLYQAYVEYLAPLGPGLRVRAGRVDTEIGAAPTQIPDRWMLSDGLVDGQLHPDPQLAVTVRSDWTDFWLLLGVANDAAMHPDDPLSNGKAFLWATGFDLAPDFSLTVSGLWGDSGAQPGESAALPSGDSHTNRVGIVNAVARWEPTDLFSAWLDFTYLWSEDLESIPCAATPDMRAAPQKVPGKPRAVGLAVASHYRVTDATGFSLRGEGLWGRDNQLDPRLCEGTHQHDTLWAITGTLDHSLLENLVVRAEGRWDAGSRPGDDDVFFRGRRRGDFESDQWTAGLQAYYRF